MLMYQVRWTVYPSAYTSKFYSVVLSFFFPIPIVVYYLCTGQYFAMSFGSLNYLQFRILEKSLFVVRRR